MVDSWQSAVCGAFAGARDYIVLGKTERGGGECENASCAKQHSSGIPDCLDEGSFTSYLRKDCLRGGQKKNPKEVSA